MSDSSGSPTAQDRSAVGGCEDDMPKVVPGFVFKHFLHEDAKIGKLVTREDNYHIHKTLGILSVCSFLYRYGYVYNTQGTLGFEGTPLDWLTMAVHTVLALSSIIFRVPRKRISNKPMVIYEEYRQHAMVFTLRCFCVFAVAVLFPKHQSYFAPVVVMAHHLLADRITDIWGTPNNTAVRATSDSMKLSSFYTGVAKLYSLYQFLAIASHILPNSRLPDLAYNAIIAIQSSAFMMTLYRKRIIRGRTHMVVYAACLAVSAFHIVRLIGWQFTALTTVTFLLRINLPRSLSNKYVIWALFTAAANWKYLQTTLASVDFAAMIATSPIQPVVEMPELQSVAGAALLYIAFQGERLLMDKQLKAEKMQ